MHTLIGLSPSNHGTTVSGPTNLIEKFPFASLLVPVFLEVIGAPALNQLSAGPNGSFSAACSKYGAPGSWRSKH